MMNYLKCTNFVATVPVKKQNIMSNPEGPLVPPCNRYLLPPLQQYLFFSFSGQVHPNFFFNEVYFACPLGETVCNVAKASSPFLWLFSPSV